MCVDATAAHAADASQDSECLLTGSFSPDGLNYFITINDRDRGTLRRTARCSGTAELASLLLSHPAASPHPPSVQSNDCPLHAPYYFLSSAVVASPG